MLIHFYDGPSNVSNVEPLIIYKREIFCMGVCLSLHERIFGAGTGIQWEENHLVGVTVIH